jgi:hypothetical protein
MLRTGSCKLQRAGSKTRLRGACSKFKAWAAAGTCDGVGPGISAKGWLGTLDNLDHTHRFSHGHFTQYECRTSRLQNREPSLNKGHFIHLISGLAQQRPTFHSKSGSGSCNTKTLDATCHTPYNATKNSPHPALCSSSLQVHCSSGLISFILTLRLSPDESQAAVYGQCVFAEYNSVHKDMCAKEFMKLKDCYLVWTDYSDPGCKGIILLVQAGRSKGRKVTFDSPRLSRISIHICCVFSCVVYVKASCAPYGRSKTPCPSLHVPAAPPTT